MAKKKHIPRLHEQGGRFYWKPEPGIRPHFKGIALGDIKRLAMQEAERLNDQVTAWQRKCKARPSVSRAQKGPLTVGQLITRYQMSTNADWTRLKQTTQATYRYCFNRLHDEFGHEIAATLNAIRVDEWWNNIQQSAPETGRHMAITARVLFNWSSRKGLIPTDHNPFRRMKIGGGKRRNVYFTWEEAKHLIETADQMELHSIGTAILIAFTCVQRISDVLRLTFNDIQDGRLVFTQSKGTRTLATGQKRQGFQVNVALPQATRERIQHEFVRRGAQMGDHLIICEGTGKPYLDQTASRVFRRVKAKAIEADPQKWGHLSDKQMRDGRRSGFVHSKENGADIDNITAISGHSIKEGMEIIETYLPRTAVMADKAAKYMDVKL